MVRSVMKDYCCFSQTEISELVNLFFGKKIFSCRTCYENIAKYSRVRKQTGHGQTLPSNMLVKKNELNEITIVGTFTQGFKD